MERSKRILSFMLAIIMALGVLPNNFVKLVVAESEKYQGYVRNEGDIDKAIYVKRSDEPERVVYCFNKYREYPLGENNPINEYVKLQGTIENYNNSNDGKTSGNFSLENINKVIYNGYPNDASSIQRKYGLSNGRFRTVTQYAIWKLTDNHNATELTGDEKKAYEELSEYSNLKSPEGGYSLDIYKYEGSERKISGEKQLPKYQNLLGATFKNGEEELKIKRTIYFQKKWIGVENGDTTPEITLDLVEKNTNKNIESKKVPQIKVGVNNLREGYILSGIFSVEVEGDLNDYTVKEAKLPEGYSYTGLGGKGIESNPITVNNTKKKKAAFYKSVQVIKKWEGKQSDKTLYFQLYKSMNGKESLVTKEDFSTGSTSFQNPIEYKGQPVNWTNLLYLRGQDENNHYDYIVKEVQKVGEQFEPWQDKNYSLKSTDVETLGTENNITKRITFTNKYEEVKNKSVKTDLKVEKSVLNLVQVPNGKFTFTLEGADENSKKVVEKQTGQVDGKLSVKNAISKIEFKDIVFTEKGEYKFNVKEEDSLTTDTSDINLDKNHYIFDKGTVEITVKVVEKENGELEISSNDGIKYTKINEENQREENNKTFKNLYVGEAHLVIKKIWKNLDNTTKTDGLPKEVKFSILADGQQAHYLDGKPVDDITVVAGNDNSWTKTIKNLPAYKKESTNGLPSEIKYTITESVPEGYTVNDGYSNPTRNITQSNIRTVEFEVTNTYNKPEEKKDNVIKKIVINKEWTGKDKPQDLPKLYYEVGKEVNDRFPIPLNSNDLKGKNNENSNILHGFSYITDDHYKNENKYSIELNGLNISKEKVKDFVITEYMQGEDENTYKPWTHKDYKQPPINVRGKVQGDVLEFNLTNSKKETEKPAPKDSTKLVKFSKKNLAGNEISGAKIELYRDGDLVETWESNGEAKELSLKEGTYHMIERIAPEGYEISTSIRFDVVKEGKDLKITNKQVKEKNTVDEENGIVTMVDAYKKTDEPKRPDEPKPDAPKGETTTVKFSKQDIAGRELAGARIVLAGDNGYRREWTSNGNVEEFNVTEGRYTFREIATPDNSKYEFATEITFEVKKIDDKLEIINVVIGSGNTRLADGTFVMVDNYRRNDFPIFTPSEPKRDKEIVFSKQNIAGKELEGAQIELLKDGRVIETWRTTGEERKFKLSEGEYVFRETIAPEGYEISTDISFTVTKDGDIVNVKAVGKNYVAGNLVVMVDDYKNSEKKEDSTKPIEGPKEQPKDNNSTEPKTTEPENKVNELDNKGKEQDDTQDTEVSNVKHLPKTGDGFNPAFYSGAMVFSGLMLGVLGYRRIRISKRTK